MTKHTLELSKIRIDGDTQSRVSINEATVQDYADAITEGAEFPDVVVFFDGAEFWLADGFHRFHATKRIGGYTVNADVRTGTRKDALLFAYGANQTHGLRRTNDDKRKAVLGVLALEPEWSDRAIGKHVGVAHSMVAALRNPERAEAQAKARTKSVANGAKVESDSTPTANRVSNKVESDSTGTVATKTASAVAPEHKAPGPVTDTEGDDDGLGDFDPYDELKRVMQELEAAHAQIKAAEADDPKAEAMKWRRAYDHAEREQSAAMDRAKEATDREAWTMRQLRRCGKAVGQEDPSKVAAAVEAMARAQKVAA